MIRALRPTDLIAYVTFCHQVAHLADPGEDSPPDGDGAAGFRPVPTVVGFLGRSLALEHGRESWVEIEHGQISGLIAAKRREGGDVWDVDQLAILPTPAAARTCTRLLDQLLTAAIDEGIHKVFLRLPEDDPAEEWAQQIGFFPYCRETTYVRAELPTLVRPPAIPGIRSRRAADHQALFQLYCSAVPARVRQAEAMTLLEWRWTDGWGARPVGVQLIGHRNRSDYVVEGPGHLTAWIQVDRRKQQIAILNDPRDQLDDAALLAYGIARLGGGRHGRCIARDYQPGLAAALEENGFNAGRRYTRLARALAARIPEVKLVPVRAS